MDAAAVEDSIEKTELDEDSAAELDEGWVDVAVAGEA